MSKGNSFENFFLLLVFNNTGIANIGDATGLRGSTVAGSLYAALHSADPGEAGDQTTSELSYTGYSRQAIARSGSGWTVSGNQVSNAALIQFGNCTAGGPVTANFVSVGVAASGASVILYRAPIGVATAPKAFTAVAATDIVTVPAHSLAVNDKAAMFSTPAAALPTGVTEGTIYFVKTVSGNDLTLSATQGGATLDITGAGSGIIAKVVGLAIDTNINPQYAIGQLVFTED